MKPPHSNICGKCKQGKHGYCTGKRRVTHDGYKPCECVCRVAK